MTLQIDLPPDVEARYAAEAKLKGISLKSHVTERLIESALATPAEIAEAARPLSLPLLKGSVVGSLSRRDIYDERGWTVFSRHQHSGLCRLLPPRRSTPPAARSWRPTRACVRAHRCLPSSTPLSLTHDG